jgi:hypothetical protein
MSGSGRCWKGVGRHRLYRFVGVRRGRGSSAVELGLTAMAERRRAVRARRMLGAFIGARR